MKRSVIAGGAVAAVLVVLGVALVTGQRAVEQGRTAPPAAAPETASATGEAADRPGFLYGRITAVDGTTYEGRLRFGDNEEAFWGDYFNGAKEENPWAAQAPPELLPREVGPRTFFGVPIGTEERQTDLARLFMARFGDVARIDGSVGNVRVTLKSGTVFELNRFGASDFDDDVRVWDAQRGAVDLNTRGVRSIEFLPTPRIAAPDRLHGTVKTSQGEFAGFVQWDRQECIGSDELDGYTAEGELSLRFDTIRSIARRSRNSSLVTQLDGREVELSDTNDVGRGHRGVYVDDPRYGRVLIAWEAFERVDFSPAGSGPAYDEFPPGSPLRGSVSTRDGRRLAGRLVYDLDESETTETLDAPSKGVNYTIPFGLVASIGNGGDVTLHNGAELKLELSGDLGEQNAGMLIFVDGGPRPEYVPWAEVDRVAFDRPPAMYPPLGGR